MDVLAPLYSITNCILKKDYGGPESAALVLSKQNLFVNANGRTITWEYTEKYKEFHWAVIDLISIV